MTAEIESVVITPVVCIFCKFSTYIEYDLELHLYENHKMGLRKLPISIPRGENSTDFRIEHAIKQGRMIGALDENSKQKLGLVFDKPKDLSREFHIPIPIHELDIQGVRTWSQVPKNSFTFMPVVSVEEFFENDPDKPYSAPLIRTKSLLSCNWYPACGKAYLVLV